MSRKADDYLRSKGIKPSYQRIRIYEYLQTDTSHPTVDVIYKALLPEISTLSKTTVYNTLRQFAEKQIVQIVSMGDSELRYSLYSDFTGHFKCTQCGTIYDFDIEPVTIANVALDGFDINETQICLKGICPKCKKQNY